MEAKMKVGQALRIAGLATAVIFLSQSSYAFDMDGAWATDVSACGKIFQKDNNNELSIKAGSDMYGSGFIVRKNSIVGNNATCAIKSRKEAGPVTHLVAECAAENVAFSTFQFSYRVNDDNNIVRIFPGIEELNVSYARCRF